MKKLIFSCCLSVCFISSALHGQTTFSPKAGINFSSFTEEFDDKNLEGNVGYQFGFDLRFGNQIYIAPGVHYFSTTSRVEEIGNIDVSDEKINFDIQGIKIPVYVGGDLIEDKGLGLRLFMGPSFSFIIDKDDDLIDFDDLILQDNTWGLNAGLGLDIGVFNFELQREWGMTNVFNVDGIKSRNNIIYLSAGLNF
ncbi:MAG TPA: outer membrane beta-barrel protein [Saprospiraceae bacterium]|nr:outer membrane beta-barrel protein [Saprospiraceae bacterium]HMQ84801.1 outer membrane beta-barrel protein [Saprospiraceae bacterium]